MKKNVIALLAGILLVPLTLAGCGTQENGSSGATATATPTSSPSTPSPSATSTQESVLPKITYAYTDGRTFGTSMFIFTSDYTLKYYVIRNSSEVDLFAGELPPDNEYTVIEYQISEEEWNALIDVLNENRFAQLPEDISIEGFDMPSTNIQVETADGVHKSGGYGAGYGDDEENKRFRAIQEELDNIIKAHEPQL